jgi:23S rRNA (guanosine2251-2'-O)-methyltransferase
MKIYGKNPVLERIKSNPRSIKTIFVQAGHPEHSYIASKARKFGIPISVVDERKMMKLARNVNAQGLLMEVVDFEYYDYEGLLETAAAEGVAFLFIDGLTDPQNLGAIIRVAGCLGRFVLVLPTHDSVHVTDTVLRIASGGDNFVKICKVSNLNSAIRKAKDAGYTIGGSVVKDGEDIRKVKFRFPLGLVIGSEDKGIREVILQNLDLKVTIPMAHPRMSLNVSHAASMLCYEITQQRGPKPKMVQNSAEPAQIKGLVEEYGLPE